MHDFLIAFIGGLMLGLSVVGYLYVNGVLQESVVWLGRY